MKYAYAMFGVLYGTVIGCLLLPFALIFSILKDVIPTTRHKLMELFNPLIYLSILPVCIFLFIATIVLTSLLAKDTCVAFYKQGWRAWSVPFKLIGLMVTEQYNETSARDIVEIDLHEKLRQAQNTIEQQAIKINKVIKQTIEHSTSPHSLKIRYHFPIEISALITLYAMQEYRKNYLNGNLIIYDKETSAIAAKKLNHYITQTHKNTWSMRLFFHVNMKTTGKNPSLSMLPYSCK